jgi:hypothetical protein
VIPNGTLIGRLDVTNLFTTMPVDETLEILKSNLEEDTSRKDRSHLSIENIMDLVRVCVYNTYFQFDDKFCRQTREMAIGSPLSPVLCNVFMENFERRAIVIFPTKPSLFLFYVDDISVEWPEDETPIEDFYNYLNSLTPHIKSTLERDKEGILAFHEVKIKKIHNKLETAEYRKPTDSGLYLQYDSNHPKPVKYGTVSNLFNRDETHSSTKNTYEKEIYLIKNVLQGNEYPRNLIDNMKIKRSKNIP